MKLAYFLVLVILLSTVPQLQAQTQQDLPMLELTNRTWINLFYGRLLLNQQMRVGGTQFRQCIQKCNN